MGRLYNIDRLIDYILILVIKNCTYERFACNKYEIKLEKIDKIITNMSENVSYYKNKMFYI